jgi:hypothetical protein
MGNTFAELSTGATEIDHIREMYEDLKESTFQMMKGKARAGIIYKNGKTHVFTQVRRLTLDTCPLSKTDGQMTTVRIVL